VKEPQKINGPIGARPARINRFPSNFSEKAPNSSLVHALSPKSLLDVHHYRAGWPTDEERCNRPPLSPLRRSNEMLDLVCQLLDAHGSLRVPAATLEPDADLYALGLTSFAAIRIMLALEEACDVQFPPRMLRRQSFDSISSILGCLEELQPIAAKDARRVAA
jgi:acyl carrier protein